MLLRFILDFFLNIGVMDFLIGMFGFILIWDK